MFASIREDNLTSTVESQRKVHAANHCRAHVYENANPFLLTEPSGIIDTSAASTERSPTAWSGHAVLLRKAIHHGQARGLSARWISDDRDREFGTRTSFVR